MSEKLHVNNLSEMSMNIYIASKVHGIFRKSLEIKLQCAMDRIFSLNIRPTFPKNN